MVSLRITGPRAVEYWGVTRLSSYPSSFTSPMMRAPSRRTCGRGRLQVLVPLGMRFLGLRRICVHDHLLGRDRLLELVLGEEQRHRTGIGLLRAVVDARVIRNVLDCVRSNLGIETLDPVRCDPRRL